MSDTPLAKQRVYAFLDENRIDFASFTTAKAGDTPTLAYYPHTIATDQLLTEALHQAMQQCPLWQGEDTELYVVANSRTLLVPLNSCSVPEAETLYYFNYPHLQGARILEDHLPTLGVALLFSIPPVAHKVITHYVPSPYYISGATPLLTHFATRANHLEAATVYICLHHHDMDVMVFVGERFWVHNKFAVNTPEDVAYYAMAMLQDTPVANTEAHYYLCGESRLLEGARQFLLRLTEHVQHLHITEAFDHPALHEHPDMAYALAVQLFSTASK